MRYFPVFLDLDARRVVVVGGSERAAQKLRLLIGTGADLVVVAERVAPEIADLIAKGRVRHLAEPLSPAHFDAAALVLVAADTPEDEAAAVSATQERGIPINVVDRPSLSSFIVPAIVDRSPVVVAIGTEGAAPVIARQLRARIEGWLPARLGEVAAAAGRLRDRVKGSVTSFEARRRLWEQLLAGRFSAHVLAGDIAAAEREAAAEIAGAAEGRLGAGCVTIVGCGPGNPELLTLRAIQCMHEADVLVVDPSVDRAVLAYARRDAERMILPSPIQADDDRIIAIREASRGRRVASLTAGDAMSGEATALAAAVRAAGISLEIVPGLAVAVADPAGK